MKHYILGMMMLLTGMMTGACSDDVNEHLPADNGQRTIQTRLAGFVVGGNDATLPAENEVTEVKACLFEDGVLKHVYENLQGTDGNYSLTVDGKYGTLYVVANTESLMDWSSMEEGVTSETDWLNKTVEMQGDVAPTFFTGSVVLEKQASNVPVEMILKRGVARVDITLEGEGIAVKGMTLKNVMRKAYLMPKQTVASPEGETTDMVKNWDEPLDANTAGVMYLYEQANKNLTVELDVTVNGMERILTAKLPENVKRNAVYTLNLGGDGSNLNLTVNVDEWDYADDTVVNPDFEDRITVDVDRTELPDGVTVEGAGNQLVMDYRPNEFVLVLNCKDQLEVNSVSQLPFEITAVPEEKNMFLVKKNLMAVGYEQMEGVVRFKRKGLNHAYREDEVTLVLKANPTTIEGMLHFGENDYTCDLGEYVDGEYAVLRLPQDRKITVEFENGEDEWMAVREKEGESGAYRVLGGWKPNDPKADGREQKAKIVICDAATGADREEYTVIRRNYGLPVVEMNGVWWCKYNAMGQSDSFDDQILVPDDPAVKAGKTVLDYLNTCSMDDYLNLWGWSYQDATGKGMRVIGADNTIKIEGYPSPSRVNINTLDPKALAPSGYELPEKAYYDRIFAVWWMQIHVSGGPYGVKSPWNGNNQVFVEPGSRTDLTIDGVVVPVTYHFEVYNKKNGIKNESVTFYGPGAQWGNGGINHNKILFGCHSMNSGWFNAYASNGEGLRESGGGANDTRILRFIKTPVEYMYE